MPSPYESFDLLIYPGPQDAPWVRVVDSQVGEAPPGRLELPFDTNELATLFRQAVGGTRNVGLATQAASNPIDVQELGSALYRGLFAGPLGNLLRSGQQGAESRGASLRIRLRIDPLLPALADLPWEFLYSPDEHRFLALFDVSPVVRYVEMAKAAWPLAGRPPLTILAVISSPSDLPQLKVEQEWGRLEKALEGARQRGDIRLERLPGATLDGLLARLDQAPVHILHFIGHGYFDAERNQGGLAFEDDNGRSRLAPAENLKTVTNHSTLRLAFLNACEGATSGRTDSFAGVAQQLVRQGLPAVVAMQFPIGDDAAITLAQTFYGALAGGDPVELALGKARRAVDARSSDFQWGTPVLFSRSDDNRLIELPQGDARPAIETKTFEPETVLIPGGPFQMGVAQGSGAPAWDMPLQTLSLPDFRMGKCPVTNAQYLAFVRERRWPVAPATGWELAPVGQAPKPGRETHPVVGITWDDAVAYCGWLSEKTGRRYRLPSEAEWEKAARGPATGADEARTYPWTGPFDPNRCNSAESAKGDTSPVGSYSPQGDSVYGCADMAGNVWEWTNTRWGGDRSQPQHPALYDPGDGRENSDKDAPFREVRIVRGGSYQEAADRVTCTTRGRDAADKGHPRRGFRVAMDVSKGSTWPGREHDYR